MYILYKILLMLVRVLLQYLSLFLLGVVYMSGSVMALSSTYWEIYVNGQWY